LLEFIKKGETGPQFFALNKRTVPIVASPEKRLSKKEKRGNTGLAEVRRKKERGSDCAQEKKEKACSRPIREFERNFTGCINFFKVEGREKKRGGALSLTRSRGGA